MTTFYISKDNLGELLELKCKTIKMMQSRGYTIRKTDSFFLKLADNIETNFESVFRHFRKGINKLKESPTPLLHFMLSLKLDDERNVLSTIYERTLTNPEGESYTDRCLVYFYSKREGKVGVEDIRIFHQLARGLTMKKDKSGTEIWDSEHKYPPCTHAIIVTPEMASKDDPRKFESLEATRNSRLTKDAFNLLNDFSLGDDFIVTQHFEDVEFNYDPGDHIYSPVSARLANDEEKEDLEEAGIHETALPIILNSDPLIKRLGLAPGDIVRILSNILVPETLLSTEVNYRLVKLPAQPKPKKV